MADGNMVNRNMGAKLILSIVERGQGRLLAKIYEKQKVTWHFQSTGHGTASSELLDVLGFGSSERDVLISLVSDTLADRLMYELEDGIPELEGCKGIICDVPLTGLGLIAATLFRNEVTEQEIREDKKMEKHTHSSLILIAANQGHADVIMNTARAAGARGGTILRSRWAGPEDTGQFYGIKIQEEKDLIAIVAPDDLRGAIMEMVNLKHGLKTEAAAVVCSVGIDQMVRLG